MTENTEAPYGVPPLLWEAIMSHTLAARSARDASASVARLALADTILRMITADTRNGQDADYTLGQIETLMTSVHEAETEFLNS